MRSFVSFQMGWLALVALALALQSKATWAQVRANRPNVLFLVCDDLNCDLGCYGDPQADTPNLDALAASGVRFENAHCQYPLCGPSRASFMTGLYPSQTTITANSIFLRERMPRVTTMSQHFRNAGYFSTRIGKIYHYNVPRNIGTSGHDDPDSWDQTFNPRGRDKEEESQIFSLQPGKFGATLSWLAAEGEDREQTDGIAAQLAVERLAHHAREGDSFFLAVGLFRPHTPFVAPRAYFAKHPQKDIEVPTIPDGYLETLPVPAVRSLTRRAVERNLDPTLATQAIQAYHASISFADAQVGLILQALRDTGLDENTIVVFTSDHGYHMGQHGHWQKTTLFEDATHVPLIIRAPGMARGKTARTMAEMVDFYPTLAELAGLSVPGWLAGHSLVPALRDPETIVRGSALTQFENGFSLRTTSHRYTEWGESGAAGRELYDRATDPEELSNLAGDSEHSATQAELARKLASRVKLAREVPDGMRQVEQPQKRVLPEKR